MYPEDYFNFESNKFVRYFSSPFDPLNNWSAHRVEIWGKTFYTAEHAYQYKKYDMTDMTIAKKIFDSPSPWSAHNVARVYKAEVRKDWLQLKYGIMQEILEAKADQHDDVREQLLKTGSREIIHNSPSDKYWGCGSDGLGENNLGKIWMRVRTQTV